MKHYIVADSKLELIEKLIKSSLLIDRKRLNDLLSQCRDICLPDGCETIEYRGFDEDGFNFTYKIHLEEDDENEIDDIRLCAACNGSGEGMAPDSVCMECKGKGSC